MNKKLSLLSLLALIFSSCAVTGGSTNPSDPNTNPSTHTETITDTDIHTEEETTTDTDTSPKISSKNPMNEPLINRQVYLNHIGDIFNTWKYYQGKGITIAVIDSDFNVNHEDFTFEDGSSKVLNTSAYFATSGNNTTTYVGKNYAHSISDSHGTMCASIAASGINSKGIIGIAPLSNLMLLRTDKKPKSIVAAFNYAKDNGAKVISISLGSYDKYTGGDLINDGSNLKTIFDQAVANCRAKNIAVISAAGNGGDDSKHSSSEPTYPGATAGVIGVGGLQFNSSDAIWTGTSINSSTDKFVDVLAPADKMYGCVCHGGKKYEGDTEYWKGTSFAAPIVAGMAALYFEKNPQNTVSQFETDLINSCISFTDKSSLRVSKAYLGAGRVDVGALLGTKISGNVSIKVRNSGTLNYYVWNSITGIEAKAWPGTYIGNNDNHTYTITLNTSNFDKIIFNDGNVQTIDMMISSFIYNNIYNLDTDIDYPPRLGIFISN